MTTISASARLLGRYIDMVPVTARGGDLTARAAWLKRIDPGTFDVLSLDMFDTVVLRDTSPELLRFELAARAVAGPSDASRLFRLRSRAHQDAYRALRLIQQGDVGHDRITSVMRTLAPLAHLDPSALRQSEIDVDCARLRPNRRLLAWASRLSQAGKRVVVVSDTYYAAADLRQMMVRLGVTLAVEKIYTSADIDCSKHFGPLFDYVAADLKVSPSRIAHIGDNAWADVAQARKAGLQAHLSPRTPAQRALSLSRAMVSRAALDRRRGIVR